MRVAGLLCSLVYAALITWIYAHQPRTIVQLTGGVASTVGAYRVDRPNFDEGLRFFRRDQFAEARAAFERADPARQDAVTQFYIAYSYYRQGWGRLYHDDELFRKGLEAVNRAASVAPGGRINVEDSTLAMHSSDELRAELERGLTRTISDLNPLKILRERK